MNKEIAWKNLLILGINAGLSQQAITLDPTQSPAKEKIFFESSGIKYLAQFKDIGFGELAVTVVAEPNSKTCAGKIFLPGPHTAANRKKYGNAFAAGWLERKDGKWLQQSTPDFWASPAFAALLLNEIKPDKFAAEGKFFF